MRPPDWLEGKDGEEVALRVCIVILVGLLVVLFGSLIVVSLIAAWQHPATAGFAAGGFLLVVGFIAGVTLLSFYVEEHRKKG